MSDPIRDLAARLARLEREVRASATAPKAPNTSVQGGRTRWLDAEGAEEVVIGVNETGEPIFRVHNDDQTARTILSVNGVLKAPINVATWQRDLNLAVDGNGRPLITSGSYTAAWFTYVTMGGKRIASSLFLNLGAGVTSAAVRITATLLGIYDSDGSPNTSSGGTQTVKEWTGITSSQQLDQSDAPWLVPDTIRSPAASPVGAAVQLLIEGRITGGSGQIWIGPGAVIVSGS